MTYRYGPKRTPEGKFDPGPAALGPTGPYPVVPVSITIKRPLTKSSTSRDQHNLLLRLARRHQYRCLELRFYEHLRGRDRGMAPHLTTNVVFAPVQTCTSGRTRAIIRIGKPSAPAPSTGPLYWDPPIPTNFPTCGFYYFYPKVDGHPSWSGCPTTTTNVGPNGQVDPFQVTVVQAQVDAVDYGSDYTAFYDYNLDFAGDGTTTFSRPSGSAVRR